ncbi:MAG: DUF4407 domain-containing protein [Bacteroidetes bacterium]|nr:MAG: DUF4407 domain-containing protein [Bacteroidota bacterium]
MESNQTIILPKFKMSLFYHFFSWCSGARLYLLKSCPTDYNKYFGIGMIVFLTGIMASITGFFALYMIFDSYWIAAVFGVFWGILIFFLDWFIVASLKKEEKFISEFLFSVPRIILAVLLAVVISKPLELKLFEKEINAVLVNEKTESSIKYKQLVDKEFNQIEILKIENENLRKDIKNKEEQRNLLFDMIIKEAEGRSPTGIIGKGPVYREKKTEFDRLNQNLDILKKNSSLQIKLNIQKIEELNIQKNTRIDNSSKVIQNSDGLLARLEAMSILKDKNSTVSMASWFIFILFILIEAAPILVKLLSRRGPYDELIDKEEYEKQIEYKKQKIKAKVLANNYLELLKQKDELQIEAEKRNNKNLVKHIEEAKEDINKKVVEKWKEKELETVLTDLIESDSQLENSTETENNDDYTEESENQLI